MSKIYIYAEVQASIPFENAPWAVINPQMKKWAGLLRKTWLSGLETNSVGGIYEFDTLEHARAYVEGYLLLEAKAVGGAGSLLTRFYESAALEEASREMQSPWLVPIESPRPKGRVFLFGEMHWSIPSAQVPWKEVNEMLKHQPGLLSKHWLSGVNTQSPAGFYEFDSKENALAFAFGSYAGECRQSGVTANVKLFNADIVEDASKGMSSPYYR